MKCEASIVSIADSFKNSHFFWASMRMGCGSSKIFVVERLLHNLEVMGQNQPDCGLLKNFTFF